MGLQKVSSFCDSVFFAEPLWKTNHFRLDLRCFPFCNTKNYKSLKVVSKMLVLSTSIKLEVSYK